MSTTKLKNVFATLKVLNIFTRHATKIFGESKDFLATENGWKYIRSEVTGGTRVFHDSHFPTTTLFIPREQEGKNVILLDDSLNLFTLYK